MPALTAHLSPACRLRRCLAAACILVAGHFIFTPRTARALEGGAEAAGAGWDAVVRFGPGCSATILQNGLLLSAAHCGIRQRENTAISRGDSAMQIGSCREPNDWSLGNGLDVALCTLQQNGAPIKGLRLATSAELLSLKAGAPVILAGYGRDSSAKPRASPNPSWGHATVLQVSTVLMVHSDSGVCPGDSGGPVLAEIHGERLIVGVISARLKQVQPCSAGYSYAARSDTALEWYDSHADSLERPLEAAGPQRRREAPPVATPASPSLRFGSIALASAIAGAAAPLLAIALRNRSRRSRASAHPR